MASPSLRIAAFVLVIGVAGVAARSDVPGPRTSGLAYGCGNAYLASLAQPALHIVTLKDGVGDPAQAARSLAELHRFTVRHVYYRAIKGFSAVLSREAIRELERDPRVLSIQRAGRVTTAQYARLVPALNPAYRPVLGQRLPFHRAAAPTRHQVWASSEAPASLPTASIDPYGPDLGPEASLAAAVLDTGIQPDHPDLSVDLHRSRSFVPEFRKPDDGRGHGTYVAGLIAGRGREGGVRGAAPGASVWAVKVMDDDGIGTDPDVIKGLDYLIARADRVVVANLSLEGPKSEALNAAVRSAAGAGIVVVAAAGNEGMNAMCRPPVSRRRSPWLRWTCSAMRRCRSSRASATMAAGLQSRRRGCVSGRVGTAAVTGS